MKRRAVLLAAFAAQVGTAACLISGTVIDIASDKPLSGTRVLARPSGKPNQPSILRMAGPQGAFCFDRLEAGTYGLVAEHSGYVPLVYGGQVGRSEGIEFAVDGSTEAQPVSLKMTRSATLAGTVTNSTGELLENTRVTLWRRIWDSEVHHWNNDQVTDMDTDDRGAFRFGHLAPGVYFLSAEERQQQAALDEKGQPAPGTGPATYFGGSFKFERATPILLEPGQDASLVMPLLPRPGGRSLTARLAPGVEHEDQATLELRHITNDHPGGSAKIGKDGSVSVHDLMPGKYSLRTYATAKIDMEVDLTDGDIEGLVLTPAVEFNVAISVLNRPKAFNSFPVRVREMATGDVRGSALGKSDGSFMIRGLKPSVYWLDWNGKEGYLKNLIIDGQPHADTVLDLRNGAPALVQAVFSENLAELSGQVDRAKDKPALLAATVVWVDETHSQSEALGETVKVDPAWQFHIEKMPPGTYRLFAIEGFDEDMWGSPELAAALREKSVQVKLGESDKKQVSLPLIPLEEWEKALRKLGM